MKWWVIFLMFALGSCGAPPEEDEKDSKKSDEEEGSGESDDDQGGDPGEPDETSDENGEDEPEEKNSEEDDDTVTLEKSDEPQAPPPSSVKIKAFGHSMHVDDEPYDLSCNQYFVNYWVDEPSPDCTAVYAESHLEFDPDRRYWTVTATDDEWELEAPQDEPKLIGPDGTEYVCHLYTGSMYKDRGEEIIKGSHLILAEEHAAKPGDLNQDSIYAIGFRSADGCVDWQLSGENE